MDIHMRLKNTMIMITHDVDEAVLLSDRIVMMTNGPAATIGEVLPVHLARPRKRLDLVADALMGIGFVDDVGVLGIVFRKLRGDRARTSSPR